MFELLKRYQRRELALIMVLVGCIAAAPLAAYLVWPGVSELRKLSATRSSLTASTSGHSQLAAQLEELRSSVSDLDQKLHGDAANLPQKEVEAFVIGRLQSISWRNRVDLVGVAPDAGDEIESFKETLFRVSLAGDYFDLYNWLNDLGTELGFVVIKNYQMSPIDRSEATPRLAAELTIASYRSIQQ